MAHKTRLPKLSDEDLTALNRWLEAHWSGEQNCPISGERNWAWGEDVVEFRPFLGGALMAGSPIYPQVMLICKDCGYTMLFAAVPMGLPSLVIEKQRLAEESKKGESDGD